MSAEYDRLLADVMPHAPGALQSAIEAELFALLRDFLQHTNIWKANYQFAVTPADLCYMLSTAAGVRVNRLHNLFDHGDLVGRNWVWPVQMDIPGTLRLLRPVSTDATWIAEVSLYNAEVCDPGDVRAAIPGWILAHYYEALLNGVVGRMQLQPLKPYSNPTLGAGRTRMYNSAKALARGNVERRNVFGAQAWTYPRVGTTIGRQRGV